MELEKRKRDDDGGSNGKRAKVPKDDDAVTGLVPADEEVDEFFAILKRMQGAVKYFRERTGRRCIDRELTATPWNPSFEREDFVGVEKEYSKSFEGNQNAGLDLNSDPASDVSNNAA